LLFLNLKVSLFDVEDEIIFPSFYLVPANFWFSTIGEEVLTSSEGVVTIVCAPLFDFLFDILPLLMPLGEKSKVFLLTALAVDGIVSFSPAF
jgi:hypothetical protein